MKRKKQKKTQKSSEVQHTATDKERRETAQQNVRTWLILMARQETGSQKIESEAEILSQIDIRKVLQEVDFPYQTNEDTVVRLILSVAYVDRKSPFEIIPALEYDGIFDDVIANYLEKKDPDKWSLSFLDLVAHMDVQWDLFGKLSWCKEGNRTLARKKFAEFLSGPISVDGHSQELYGFIVGLFRDSSILLNYFCGAGDDRRCQLCKMLIAQAKKSTFLWDFEKLLE